MIEKVNIEPGELERVYALGVDRAAGWIREHFQFEVGKSQLTDRLRAVAKWAGISEMAAVSGVSVSGVKGWLSARGAEPGVMKMAALAKAKGLSMDYLVSGKPANDTDFEVESARLKLAASAIPVPTDEIRQEARRVAIAAANEQLALARRALEMRRQALGSESPGADFAFVPRYDVAASAGPGALAIDETVTERIAFRRDWFREIGVNPIDCSMLTADGDSMFPTIPDGSLMLVERIVGEPLRSGHVYVLIYGGEVLVKRVSRNVDGTIDLISDNPLYPVQTIDQSRLDGLEPAGRVVWIGRRL